MKLEFDSAERSRELTLDWNNFLPRTVSVLRKKISAARIRGEFQTYFAIEKGPNVAEFNHAVQQINKGLIAAKYRTEFVKYKFKYTEGVLAYISWSAQTPLPLIAASEAPAQPSELKVEVKTTKIIEPLPESLLKLFGK